MAEQNQPTPEDNFRSALEDAIAIVEKLLPTCGSADDMVEVMRLALTNDGQLRFIMREVTPLSKR